MENNGTLSYLDPKGNKKTGYTQDGRTYVDQGHATPVGVGSIVDTQGGEYIMTDSGGQLYSDYLKDRGTGQDISAYQPTQIPAPNNHSAYVNDLYTAKQDAAMSALESAYKNNVATLDASQANIAPTYQAARNQTAATSEQGKRNFAEYANARGLNSGTGGQAELARNVTLQGNMNALNQAEGDANAAINLQRTKVANDYNTAIASAQAGGDYERASALYQEAVRVDGVMRQNALSQAGLDNQQWQRNYTMKQDALNRTDKENARQLQQAQTKSTSPVVSPKPIYCNKKGTINHGRTPVIYIDGIEGPLTKCDVERLLNEGSMVEKKNNDGSGYFIKVE